MIATCLLVACDDSRDMKNLEFSRLPDHGITYEQQQGKYLFDHYCVVCHGSEGAGDGFNAFNLDPRPKDFTDAGVMAEYTDDRLVEAIVKGGRGVNRSVLMPAWGNTLKPYQIQYIVEYIRTLAAGEDSLAISD